MKKILSLFILLITFSMSLTAQESTKTVNGLNLSTDNYNTKLIQEMKDRVADNTFKMINSVVVLKKGDLLVEEYFNGAERHQVHNPRSVGKTFASAMLGIAIKEGHIESTNQTLGEFYNLKDFKNYDPKKADVTLEHLITMSSGFEAFDFDPNSIGNEENMYPTSDWVKWGLDLPMASNRSPGDQWFYFTGGIVLLGDIIDKAVPVGLVQYTDQKLFQPLGITNYRWQYTPTDVGNTAGGLALTPIGFAKFGQLYQNKGKWEGKQVIPEEWVDVSHTVHKQTGEEGLAYGYLWWHKSYTVNGKSHSVFACSGNGGNKIFVFEDIPYVIVVTASAYGRPYMHRQVDQMMEDYILPAVLD